MRSRCFGSMFAWILKMKPENAGCSGRDRDAAHHARFGRGRVFQEAVEQELHAEVVDGAAEEDRRGFAREHGGVVPIVPGVFEHFQLFDRPVKRRVVEPAADEFGSCKPPT